VPWPGRFPTFQAEKLSPQVAVEALPCPKSMTEGVDAELYRTGPAPGKKFRVAEARDVIQGTLKSKLSGATYDPDSCAALSKDIADEIKQALKGKEWPRYKYVVHVVIAEQKGEGVQLACRCFWDDASDGYATDIFENKHLFAVASVYGVYFY
jgi:tctex1 domain-containing protein 2